MKFLTILRHKFVCKAWGVKNRFGPHVQFSKMRDCYYLRLAWYGRPTDWNTVKGILMSNSEVRDVEIFIWRKERERRESNCN